MENIQSEHVYLQKWTCVRNCLIRCFCFIVLATGTHYTVIAADRGVGLPVLGFEMGPQNRPIVTAVFPGLPGQIFDSWSYEGPWVQFVSWKKLSDGRIEMNHRFALDPPYIVATSVIPHDGSVEFLARAHADPDAPAGRPLPDTLRPPNICFQVQRAPLFSSKPDPYPDFRKRCFIMTKGGQTFLDRLPREKTWHPADDPRNNPPWVQRYLRIGQVHPDVNSRVPTNTTDRFTIPVIGIISRDGKYLTALGNDSSGSVLQMWFDCLHNNPVWLPRTAPMEERSWRFIFYVQENELQTLLQRVVRDYPNLQ